MTPLQQISSQPSAVPLRIVPTIKNAPQEDIFNKPVTILQACQKLGIKDPSTVRRALREGKCIGQKFGRDWQVTYNDVLAWRRRNKGKRGRPRKTN